MPERSILPHWALLGALIVGLWLAIALSGLANRPLPIFDEVFHVHSGVELAAGLRPTEISHPPFVKDVTAAALLASGSVVDPMARKWQAQLEPADFLPGPAWYWRLPSVLAGAISLVVLGLLTRAMLGPGPAPVVAVALLALDGCFFVHARVAMTNIWEVMFVLIAALAAWKAAGDAPGTDRWLALAGAACGAAVACRWSALAPFALTGGWLAWRLRGEPGRWLALGASFTLLPALVYAAAYAPLVAVEPLPGAADLLTWQGWKTGFIDAQLRIFEFHANLRETHPDQSPWWSWPFMVRPAWYALSWGGQDVQVVWAIGNAAIWWASLPALLTAALVGRKQPAFALVALLAIGPWLAWAIQPRTLTFMHYFLPAIPFACLVLAAIAQAWWRGLSLRGGPAPIDRASVRLVTGAYALAAASWFVFYYPVLSYQRIPKDQALMRIWFEQAWL